MNAYLKKRVTLRERKQRMKRFFVSASFRAGLVVYIVAFSALYIWQTNMLATKGFEISDLENRITDLERDNRRLEVQIAQHSSIQNIQERLKSTELVQTADVEYISLSASAVARR